MALRDEQRGLGQRLREVGSAAVQGSRGARSDCCPLQAVSIGPAVAKGKGFSWTGLPQDNGAREGLQMAWPIFPLQTGPTAHGKEQGSTRFSRPLSISSGCTPENLL